jgi:pimeloyl-ACP methyl ester carboxylesterase
VLRILEFGRARTLSGRPGVRRALLSSNVKSDVNQLFHLLLDEGLDEIRRRQPDYFSCFVLRLIPVDRDIDRYRRHPLFADYPTNTLAQALSAALAHMSSCGITIAETNGKPEPVATTVLDSAMDAFGAAQGRLPMRPPATPCRTLAEVLSKAYDERLTPSGIRYLIRRRGNLKLVLINAIGIPLSIWSRFLEDPTHDFRTIIVQSRCCDLIKGGMSGAVPIAVDSADIEDVLAWEAVDRADVLGWCNGGRVAIDIASRNPGRIRSVVLLSPTMQGIAGAELRPSAFEDSLEKVFRALDAHPQLAPGLVKLLLESQDTHGVAAERVRAMADIFSLPAKEHSSALLVPLSRSESLFNYCRRVRSSADHPIHESLASLEQPVMLISGDHDNIINNAQTFISLQTWARNLIRVNVSAAGHYIQDLQYRYFRMFLDEFLISHRAPISSARVQVDTTRAHYCISY